MTTRLEPFTSSSFPAQPELACDIVMKGGITSGVIYPLAVCELAQTYRLRSVGGSSAGAIAAAAAAAAEVGRASGATGPTAGFVGLAGFPDLLTEKKSDGRSLLFHLFRPQPSTERLFGLLTLVLDRLPSLPSPATPRAYARLGASLISAGVRAFPKRSLVGAVPGVLLLAAGLAGIAIAIGRDGPAILALSIVVAAPAVLIGAALAGAGVAAGIVSGLLHDVEGLAEGKAGFGISSGMGERDEDIALTPWLHARLQALAGRTTDEAPLTFADLSQREIDFKLMTTNLSRAQPLAMPWSNHTYYFRPEEFSRLFPRTVVQAMESSPPPLPPISAPATRRDEEVQRAHALQLGFLPFPPAEALPILVATRMSLSFPFLISAVPLYAVDYTLEQNSNYSQEVGAWRTAHPGQSLVDHVAGVMSRPRFDLNWFSDGGLAANLPVNFFDSPLPTRPTFAIDLASFGNRLQSADEELNSYLPGMVKINSGGLHRRTADWSDKHGLRRLAAFAAALLGTARTWVDEAQLVMPGYRDRIVTVYQSGAEGGLNLSMGKDVVAGLSDRGRFAARKLIHQFTAPVRPGSSVTGWDNHRWIRFRTATAGLSEWFEGFERGYPAPATTPPTIAYDTMLASADKQPGYKIDGLRLKAAVARTADLRAAAANWASKPADAFTQDTPAPPPVLRLVTGDARSE
jgi:predicted acylesterase/phospholipase RssA